MGTIRRLFLLGVTSAILLHAGSVAVAIDVSGTMRQYGAWQADARDLISSILSGQLPQTSKFSSTGDASAAAQFKLAGQEGVYFLEFGSLQKHEPPFFDFARQVGSVREFQEIFPLSPETYRQANTNRDLARAVAANSVGPPLARVIVISDFLVDAKLGEVEQTYINQFESRSKIETPLVYVWSGNHRVLVKLLSVSFTDASVSTPGQDKLTAAAPAAEANCQVQIFEARRFDSRDPRLEIRWRTIPKCDVKSYSLRLTDIATRRVVEERFNIAVPALTLNSPAPGNYLAAVSADLADGSRATSHSFPVRIDRKPFPVLPIVGVLALIGAVVFFFKRRSALEARTRGTQRSQEDT